MNATIDSSRILEEIDTLGYIDKLNLLSYISRGLIKSSLKPTRSLAELRGLGREIWQNCDIDNYVQNERASWE